MLRKEAIINFVSQNEGIDTSGIVDKFSNEYNIKTNSVKNHIYQLKLNNFLEEKRNKLYTKNPFDDRFKKIIEAKNSYQLYKNLSELVNEILIVLKNMSPSIEKKLNKLLTESMSHAYRFTRD